MANEHQFLANSATAARLNARCRDAITDHGASYAGERKRKRCQMEKQHEEEADGITAAIPADILGDVLKRMNPEEAIRLSSVCRFWRAPALACDPTRRPTPWKITLTQSDDQLHLCLQSVANASIILNIRSVRVCPGAVTCLGSWHGWLALRLLSLTEHLFLLNPFSRVQLSLPRRDSLRNVLCLTSDPGAPGCAVIAHDLDSNLVIWRPGDKSWTVQAVEGGLCPSCSAVWFKEQLLVLEWNPSNMRLLSVQLNPPRCKDLQVKFCRDMLDHSEVRSFELGESKYLVESEGNVLAFVVIECPWAYGHKSRRWVGVFRLDWDAMAFVRVESGGIDRALFLVGGGQSFSVSTGEAGCSAGCIYLAESYKCFPQPSSHISWHCCSLKDHTVTSVQNQGMKRSCRSVGQFWICCSF